MAVPKVLVENKDEETPAHLSDASADPDFRVDLSNDAQTALQKCEWQHVLLVESDLQGMDGVEIFDDHNAVMPAWVRFWSFLFEAAMVGPARLSRPENRTS